MTTKTVQERAVLEWLRQGAKRATGLSALPPEKVGQARERNRRFHERRMGRR